VTQEPEIGSAEPRGRPRIPLPEAGRILSDLTGESVELGPNIVAHGGPTTCPACGSAKIEWAVQLHDVTEEDVHPLIWHKTEWLADTWVCNVCQAGWIEPDEPAPITWVRPYRLRRPSS
jgi:hypothetical protein